MKSRPIINPERILVLAPTGADVASSRTILANADLECEICVDHISLRGALESGAGAVLTTEEMLAPPTVSGLIEALQEQPTWSDVCIIVLCSDGADSRTAKWAMERLGNVTVLERPVRAATLVSALRTAIRARLRQYRLRDQMEALDASEQRFSRFMEHLPGLAWLKDKQGRYVYVNESAARAFQVDRSDLYGKTDEEVFPPNIAAAFRENDRRAARNETGLQTVEELEHADGVHISVVSKFPIPGNDAMYPLVGGVAIDITEQKRAEEALQESEESHRRLMRLLPVAVYTCEAPTGVIAFYNDHAAILWGRAPKPGDTDERFCGSFRLWRPDGTLLPHEETPMAVAMRDGREFRNEGVIIERPDGSRIHVLVNIDPIRDGDGKVIGAINAFHDTTELNHMQEALRESEERFRQLATNAPAAVFVKDLEGKYTVANPLASEALGKPEGAAGFTDHDLLPADVADELHRADWEVIATGAAVQNEEIVRRPGYDRRFLSVKFPLYDASGQPQGVCGVAIDVTERQLAEQALRKSEERFRMLADNIAQCAWMADRLGWATWYNKRWYDYTGTTWEDMQARGWERVVHPDHLDRVNQSLTDCVTSGVSWEDVFPLKGADGRYRWFLSRAVPIRDESGRIVRWFGTNTDITVQREAEENLRDSDRRKDEFLAMLAHELRNPLAPIRSGLDVLSHELGTGHEVIQIMQEQIEHVVRLVDDLLDVSRIVRGRIELRRETVELSAIVHRAVSAVEPTLKSRRHELRLFLPGENVWLKADPVRLIQIIENLLNNAAKYTDEGGRIELRAECVDSELNLMIRDNGIGVDAGLLPRIFDLFTQSTRSLDRSQGGLGIGLTLIRNLVELHGGSISVASEGPGRGSEFTVRLPLARPPEKSNSASQRKRPAVKPRRVLVVDDNRAAARMLALLLSKQNGHQIEIAHDGAAALELLQAFQPEVVLLDIGLPGLSGYDVARAIRANPRFDGILLAALTGYGQQEDIDRSKAAGFDEHLVKPPTLDELQRLLSHSRLDGAPRAGHKPPPAAGPRSGVGELAVDEEAGLDIDAAGGAGLDRHA